MNVFAILLVGSLIGLVVWIVLEQKFLNRELRESWEEGLGWDRHQHPHLSPDQLWGLRISKLIDMGHNIDTALNCAKGKSKKESLNLYKRWVVDNAQ